MAADGGDWQYKSIIPDLGTRCRKVCSLTLQLLYREENISCTCNIGGRMDPRTRLETVEKSKYRPCRESNPGPLSSTLSLYCMRNANTFPNTISVDMKIYCQTVFASISHSFTTLVSNQCSAYTLRLFARYCTVCLWNVCAPANLKPLCTRL
jgi:hypothetical protein